LRSRRRRMVPASPSILARAAPWVTAVGLVGAYQFWVQQLRKAKNAVPGEVFDMGEADRMNKAVKAELLPVPPSKTTH
jgi:hypothetical protein